MSRVPERSEIDPEDKWDLTITHADDDAGEAAYESVTDRIDDLWTGFYLGATSLGFYSRAYTFATYPRQILAAPTNTVAAGTYAELKGKRRLLSQAFFRINALLVRTGFFLAGILVLIAPEFIRIVLGEKWMPMLTVFRLMLVFTLLDPIKITVGYLFVAMGKPEQLLRVQVIQLTVLVGGVYLLGPSLDIVGVALAVDAMLVVGIAILLQQARKFVNYSLLWLFGAPSVALSFSLLAAYSVGKWPAIIDNDWWIASAKAGVFALVFAATLIFLEWRRISETVIAPLRHMLVRSKKETITVKPSDEN
jgi:O-antigen/teichoic acid export membrane protein